MSETHTDDNRIELSLPARPESLDLVHPALDQLWSVHEEIPEHDRFRFETAVVEVFANIVEHAFREDADLPATQEARRLDLVLAVRSGAVEADFSDNGLPVALDLSGVTMPDPDAESGRGLAMAIASLDDLSYERREGRNRWRLVCWVPAT
jgi:serine/threonine-protein kinase RsbW